ncbi:hypothetical protein PIB30_026748 [Stylosanthes scabra]|uniref:ADP-ribosyl cyclase/cyclic ADP-ribose hydrolase n=1 Tax=Stylosanthes scabra TaxID=79078 RepID=A0ABU6VBE5_9FABA|nr:hypothetical protein [Stylosanthes scabra]
MDLMRIQSSSSHMKNWKYDVFVSFRGGDTRNNFTDHLFYVLRRHGILAFRDDTKLQKGGPISEGLTQAIEGSHVLIVVFSMNYASSTWCLRELANIANCIQIPGQHVLPIFYDVSPAEVRWQSGNYEKAFMKHEQRYKDDAEMMEQVQRWRAALTQVANLSGWDVKDKPQSAEIERIVKAVSGTLSAKPSSSVSNDIVGMQSPLQELERLLALGLDDVVRVVGICGMGGIGKSTLATILYEKISHQYDVSFFVDDVSKTYRDYGQLGLQRQLLYQAFPEENFATCNFLLANNLIQSRCLHRKVLIVLDNVEKGIQLEKLAIKREWVGRGSRIIIVSRDEHILREYGADEVYKVKLLNHENALQLFCKKAFKSNHVVKDYESLTESALGYAKGLPLAIRVLGSFLFGRDVSQWSSALLKLEEKSPKDIMDVLRVSFDGLEDMEKDIFLDIACFFPHDYERYVKDILRIRGFHPDIVIRTLIDKSLITCYGEWIVMHNMLRDLGRNIVREKSPKEPRKWSRLWKQKDLSHVLRESKAAKNLEAIVLSTYPEITEELSVEALSKMNQLKLLILGKVNFSGSLHFLSNELGYVEWKGYPFTCLPSSFQPNKLVKLILHHSNIKELWQGIKDLHNLSRMELCHSKNLVKIPNLSQAPNLEHLNLEGCVKLVHLHPSIGSLEKLRFLNLKNCKNLVNIPNLSQTPNLEHLDLKGCDKLVHLDASIGSLKKLCFLNLENCKKLVSIPNTIFHLNSLKILILSGCSKLFKYQLLEKPKKSEQLNRDQSVELERQMRNSRCKTLITRPLHFISSRRQADSVGLLLVPSLSGFPALTYLDISFCNLVQIPDAVGNLLCLESLNIGGNNIITLPDCIKKLPKLRELNLEYCMHLKWLPTTHLPIGRVRHGGLYVFNCPKLSDTEDCRQTAISWMIKVIKCQVNLQHSFPRCHIEVVIPGSKIPRWFNKQNTGDSVRLDTSPILYDDNWIGIACCVTFVVHDTPTQFLEQEIHTPSLISCGFRSPEYGEFYSGVPLHLKKDLITTELDHMLLMFFTRDVFSDLKEGESDLHGIGLALATESDYPEQVVQVKSCGYRWVFKRDLEQ